MYQQITTSKDDQEPPIGNKDMIFAMKMEGKLGIFPERPVAPSNTTHITIDTHVMWTCAHVTMVEVLKKHMQPRQYKNVGTIAADIADGIVVMTYLKLRSVNSLDLHLIRRYLEKPMVVGIFEIPEPYALAISQLGAIKVSGLCKELIAVPTIPPEYGPHFGLPVGRRWGESNYKHAVDMTKRLGVRFSGVDLTVKMGSSCWWLYQPVTRDDWFELCCVVPEDNFTEESAVLRSLFCINAEGGWHSDLVDLVPLGGLSYGSMFRNPLDRVDLLVYFAVSKELYLLSK